jgi:hypothetical protein
MAAGLDTSNVGRLQYADSNAYPDTHTDANSHTDADTNSHADHALLRARLLEHHDLQQG